MQPAPAEKPRIEVVGAVILRDGLVLCAQRSTGALAGMWEFPGGKVEPGETARDALAREIEEELGCAIRIGNQVAVTTHEAATMVITLTTYYCLLLDGEPDPLEHAELRWVSPARMQELPWAPADLPAVRRIQADHA
ncbi:(deoxy)nucleoside triphosphate pyrophosphohydrolase [Nocardioides sp.]|uniref:(deoxy)nucleoside triphosphate pyrophosphohydrolase n=1 Tax=Nocardioides sp. TaxID=35761 RepID=UPI002BB581EF|nr:(deoxy)nucleoside triphosphate pyrophosphohydrolase [Nocardioides sp.]HSX66172.1 (deoxy)nucleoside triphosphate pyrophosphohydrolase [Nocardioides sp.]